MARMKQRAIGGVYAITCAPTGECYIGATSDLRRRRLAHFSSLRKGTHLNLRLQAAFLAHGESSLSWASLEVTPAAADAEAWLREAEHRWHAAYRRTQGVTVISSGANVYRTKGAKSARVVLSEFRAHCESRGLRFSEELCRVLAASIQHDPRPAAKGRPRTVPQPKG